tara:strand:- start:10 stop:243 length:234 start_codon:yes stop_codon:yes gene_type:complete
LSSDDDDDDDDDDAFVLRSPLQSDAALRAGEDEINLTPPEKETTKNNGAPEEGRKVLLLLLTGAFCAMINERKCRRL